MTRLPIYQIDAFAEAPFRGNPAAVCPLTAWLPDATLQAIAAENNLAETAYFVADETGAADFLLRWFTPTFEIELCGHATLASAHVLFEELGFARATIRFRTLRAGMLEVSRADGLLWLDFPSRPPQPCAAPPPALIAALGRAPQEVLQFGNKFFAVYASAAEVADLVPDFTALRALHETGVVVTAPGRTAQEDFVSRFFAPGMGVDEDPATGSAHCLLVPYWAQRLGKTRLEATQISARRGRFRTELRGTRVLMGGTAQLYLRGEIFLP